LNLFHRNFKNNLNPSTEDNIFERLYKESKIKTRKRENFKSASTEIQPYHKRNFSQINTDYWREFDSLKIEDKLMQKYVLSQK